MMEGPQNKVPLIPTGYVGVRGQQTTKTKRCPAWPQSLTHNHWGPSPTTPDRSSELVFWFVWDTASIF
eukprot:2778828-Alexandrium_andersonii.AAC.1